MPYVNLVANLSGSKRYEMLNGRRHIVVPLSMLVPGVLNGSQGPGLYGLDEIQLTVDAWNHMPIVRNHPMRNGKHVSGRDPQVIEEDGLGYVFHADAEDKLTAEGWFDEQKTKSRDPIIYRKILNGEPLELSTGLKLSRDQSRTGTFNQNGKERGYTWVARGLKPDHLAVLPESKGACSVDDGCGVNVNEAAVDNAWSPEAREAALEARRSHGGSHKEFAGKAIRSVQRFNSLAESENKQDFHKMSPEMQEKHSGRVARTHLNSVRNYIEAAKRTNNPKLHAQYIAEAKKWLAVAKQHKDWHEGKFGKQTNNEYTVEDYQVHRLENAIELLERDQPVANESSMSDMFLNGGPGSGPRRKVLSRKDGSLYRFDRKTAGKATSHAEGLSSGTWDPYSHTRAAQAHREAAKHHSVASDSTDDKKKAYTHDQIAKRHLRTAVKHERLARRQEQDIAPDMTDNAWSDAARLAAAQKRRAGSKPANGIGKVSSLEAMEHAASAAMAVRGRRNKLSTTITMKVKPPHGGAIRTVSHFHEIEHAKPANAAYKLSAHLRGESYDSSRHDSYSQVSDPKSVFSKRETYSVSATDSKGERHHFKIKTPKMVVNGGPGSGRYLHKKRNFREVLEAAEAAGDRRALSASKRAVRATSSTHLDSTETNHVEAAEAHQVAAAAHREALSKDTTGDAGTRDAHREAIEKHIEQSTYHWGKITNNEYNVADYRMDRLDKGDYHRKQMGVHQGMDSGGTVENHNTNHQPDTTNGDVPAEVSTIPDNYEESDEMSKLNAQQRTELISNIVTNCECWKGGEKELAAMTDDRLSTLNDTVKKEAKFKAAIDKGITVGNEQYVLNSEGAWAKKETKVEPAINSNGKQIKFEDLPKEWQSAIGWATNEQARIRNERLATIKEWTGNEFTDEELNGMPEAQLEKFASMAKKAKTSSTPQSTVNRDGTVQVPVSNVGDLVRNRMANQNYSGAASGQGTQVANDDKPDGGSLGAVEYDWDVISNSHSNGKAKAAAANN